MKQTGALLISMDKGLFTIQTQELTPQVVNISFIPITSFVMINEYAAEISQTVPKKTRLEKFKNPETNNTTHPNSKQLGN